MAHINGGDPNWTSKPSHKRFWTFLLPKSFFHTWIFVGWQVGYLVFPPKKNWAENWTPIYVPWVQNKPLTKSSQMHFMIDSWWDPCTGLLYRVYKRIVCHPKYNQHNHVVVTWIGKPLVEHLVASHHGNSVHAGELCHFLSNSFKRIQITPNNFFEHMFFKFL